MKKQILISLTLLSPILTINAQIYTPSGTIQGSSNSYNVGIGVTSPSHSLELADNYDFGTQNSRYSFWYNFNYSGYKYDTNYDNYMGVLYSSVGLTLASGPAQGGNIVFKVNNTSSIIEAMRINSLGNVGIGTNNPDSRFKLDVIGTIRAREVKVDLNGADFVFEKDYKLMSLNELEKFVKEQKHLPEVAPAKEMKENGTDLGNLNSKLLQKMEEMTLYIIEQNKKIQALEEKIEKLESVSK